MAARRRRQDAFPWLPLAPGSTQRTRAQDAFLKLSPAKQQEMFHEITHYSPDSDDESWEEEFWREETTYYGTD